MVTELFAVNDEVYSGAVVVHAKGEVDASTVETLASRLTAALEQAATHAPRLLVIDLQKVTFFGSAGLSALLKCHTQGAEAGTAVRLVADNCVVVRPIELTKLDSVLDLYPTLSDALQRLEKEP